MKTSNPHIEYPATGIHACAKRSNRALIKDLLLSFAAGLFSLALYSQVQPAHIFGDNMVLQREEPIRIWGWAAPGEKVTVEFGGQIKYTDAATDRKWMVILDPLKASSHPRDLKISGVGNSFVFRNILVGDVWIMGGQSNMEFDLSRIFQGDAEVVSANFPEIRLMTVPRAAGQNPVVDFKPLNEYDSWFDQYEEKGSWLICSPETVKKFSGLGYIFGRRVYMASQIPIGLIDVSRGGTTVEAWISPERLAATPEDRPLLKEWREKVLAYSPEKELEAKVKNWEKRSEQRTKNGLPPEPKPTEPSPSPALDMNFPGSSFNGMIAPIAGLTVKGILFHQGYNNALLYDSRPDLYAVNFKTLIIDWREAFQDSDLSFGIIEFSAGGEPQTLDNFELAMVDPSPFIREGQFIAYQEMKNTGYVCSYDQQVNWYHPQKKAEIAERAARWALSEIYGFDLGWKPAMCIRSDKLKDKIFLTFNKEVKTSDDRPFEGFAIAGDDRHFYPAEAAYVIKGKDEAGKPEYDETRLEIRSELVKEPVAVRYAWARCPLGNMVNADFPERVIPVPMFRTDTWNFPGRPFDLQNPDMYRQELKGVLNQANEWIKERKVKEAELILKDVKTK